jgi:hypothetical protein
MQSGQPDKRPTAKLQTRKLERPTAPAPKPGQVLSRNQIVSQLAVMSSKGASPMEMRNWAKEAGADPMELEHMVDQASRGGTSGRLTATYTRTSTRNTGTGGPINVQSTRSKSGMIWIVVGILLAAGGGFMSWQRYQAIQGSSESMVTPWWAAMAIGLVVIVKGMIDLRKVG